MSDDKPYLLDGHMYQYDLGWMIQQLLQFKQDLDTAIDKQAITYADPIQWDITTQYTINTVVIDPQTGTAYMSKKAVPQGILLTDTDYWLPIFNYQEELSNVMQGIANVESGTTASKVYQVNDLLWYKSNLYRVTRAIAAGGNLIPDLNLTPTTVESLLVNYYGRDRSAQVTNDVINVSGDYTLTAGDISETADNITLHSTKDVLLDADGKLTTQVAGTREVDIDGNDSLHVDGITTINRGGSVTEAYGATFNRRVTGSTTEIYGDTNTTTYQGKRFIYGQGMAVDVNNMAIALKTKTLPINFPDKIVDLYKIADKTVYTVTEYGARGDGTTDDTTAIQACLTAAGANATVIFPSGSYLISATISYLSGQQLIGMGNATIIAGSAFPESNYMLRPTAGTTGGYDANINNLFYGLAFNANGKQVTSLILGHSKNNKVINCKFKGNSGWHQIEVNSSEFALIDGCLFTGHTGTGEMVQFDSAQEVGAPGITPYDDTVARYCTVSNCFFEGNYSGSGDVTTTLAGVGSHSNVANCRDILITGCIFKFCWIGVSFRYVVDLTVEGCLFHTCGDGCRFNALSVTSALDRSRYVCVRNNTFYTQKNCVDFNPALTGTVSDRCMITDNQLVSVSGIACRPYCDASSLIHGNVMVGGLSPVTGNAAMSHNNLINGTWTS